MSHLDAVEAAIIAAKLSTTDAALVELLRTLARQMDAAGPDGPGTRLAASYLTALRTLAQRARETASTRAEGHPAASKTATLRARAAQRRALVNLDDRRTS